MRLLPSLLLISTLANADVATPRSASTPVSAFPIDDLFRAWEKKLPEPATLSEENGHTIECNRGPATLTLLAATAEKVRLRSDADAAALVQWARHGDPCIRQIAIEAIIAAVGFDRNRLSVPDMHSPDHVLFHEIVLSLKAWLDGKHIPYDAKIFLRACSSTSATEKFRRVRTFREP
jgi:hypothetical protein